MKKTVSIIKFIIFNIILIILDQFTKFLAVKNLSGKSDLILIPGVLQFHYLENTGAAFSLLEGKSLLFLIATPIILILLFVAYLKMPSDKKFIWLKYIIVFLSAGAIGNYIDRFTNGYVIDFIYFSLINFPVFNVADIYVTCSVILMIILVIFYYKEQDLDELQKAFKSNEKK